MKDKRYFGCDTEFCFENLHVPITFSNIFTFGYKLNRNLNGNDLQYAEYSVSLDYLEHPCL